MNESEFERMLAGLAQKDASVGTEAFRDELLARCLAVLNEGDECVELSMEQLEMLSAAGNPSLFARNGDLGKPDTLPF